MLRKVFFIASVLSTLVALTKMNWPVSEGPLLPTVKASDPSSPSDAAYGLINSDGRVIARPVYSEVGVREEDSRLIGAMQENGDWSLVNMISGEIFPGNWEEIEVFSARNMALVKKGGSWFLLDSDGNKVGPSMGSNIKIYPPDEDLFPVERVMSWGWMDEKGRPFPSVGTNRWEAVYKFDKHGMAPVKNDDKWGWVHRDGRVIEPKWNCAYQFDDGGMAMVESEDFVSGWVDLEGKLVIEPKWDQALEFDSEGIAAVMDAGEVDVKGDERWGWINRDGDIVIPLNYSAVKTHADREYQVFWPSPYNDYEERHVSLKSFGDDGTAMVRDAKSEKWGTINRNDEPVISFSWDDIKAINHPSRIAVKTGSRWGLIDREENVIAKPQWEDIGEFGPNGLISVYVNELWGWADENGNIIIEPNWRNAEAFDENGVAAVDNAEGYSPEMKSASLINLKGQKLAPLEEGGWMEAGSIRVGERYYFCVGVREVGLIRKWLIKFKGWVSSEDQPVSEEELVLIWLTPDGKVIWDSRSISYEARWGWVIGVSIIVALLSRPRRKAVDQNHASEQDAAQPEL